MTSHIKCKCGSTSYHTEKSGPHLKAICNDCNKYIQFIPQGVTDETRMFYGKYKDRQLKDIPADYWVWMYENNRLSGSLKVYVAERIELFKQQIFDAK